MKSFLTNILSLVALSFIALNVAAIPLPDQEGVNTQGHPLEPYKMSSHSSETEFIPDYRRRSTFRPVNRLPLIDHV
ncbi:hypothetical protein CPB84DRAFT_1787355, partial [Gymnopilus junonius]